MLAKEYVHQILSAEPGLMPIVVEAATPQNTVGYNRSGACAMIT